MVHWGRWFARQAQCTGAHRQSSLRNSLHGPGWHHGDAGPCGGPLRGGIPPLHPHSGRAGVTDEMQPVLHSSLRLPCEGLHLVPLLSAPFWHALAAFVNLASRGQVCWGVAEATLALQEGPGQDIEPSRLRGSVAGLLGQGIHELSAEGAGRGLELAG